MESPLLWTSVSRPRTKDLIDIILLLEHNEWSEQEISRVAIHFVDECKKDGIGAQRLLHYTNHAVSHWYATKEKAIKLAFEKVQDYPTNFGFSFPYGFDLRYIHRTFQMKDRFDSMADLLWLFESLLWKMGIAEEITILTDR